MSRTMELLLVLACLGAVGCDDDGGRHSHPFPSQPGVIQQPTLINLYPSSQTNRLYVMVTSVGSQTVSMPLAFDTGSAGITLDARVMGFPSTLLDSTGFLIPSSESSITFNGITVTNQVGTRTYGGSGGKTQTGNLGFARVTFGDPNGELTTRVMPVFLYYLVTSNDPTHAVTKENHDGWFGVNTEANKIAIQSSTMGAPNDLPCTLDTEGDCYVVSVLKYLSFADWLDAGFALAEHPLEDCNVFAVGCPPVAMLTVGLTNEIESGFSRVTLTCPQNDYPGPDIVEGYLVCQDLIPFTEVTIAVPGKSTLSQNLAVLFDSGNPAADIDAPSGSLSTTLPAGSTVTVVTPSGFSYSYMTQKTGIKETSFNSTINTGFGINFFTEHSFFIDLASGTEGWM